MGEGSDHPVEGDGAAEDQELIVLGGTEEEAAGEGANEVQLSCLNLL